MNQMQKPSFWSCICCDELHDLRKVMQLTALFHHLSQGWPWIHWLSTDTAPTPAPMCRAAAAGCWGDDFRFSETALNNTDMFFSSIMLILETNFWQIPYFGCTGILRSHLTQDSKCGPALVVLLVLPDCT